MSVSVALLFFFTVYILEMVGKGVWFRPWVRGFIGDYAYPVSPPQSLHYFLLAYLVLKDRHNVLDRFCSFSGPTESNKYQQVATHSSFLSDCQSRLARRLLEPGGQVDLCCFASWILANASFLL